MIVEDPETLQLYGHAPDLAQQLSIPNAYDRLRDWIRSGKVQPLHDPDGHELRPEGRPVYSMADVYAAELSTRRRGKRARHLTMWRHFAQSVP